MLYLLKQKLFPLREDFFIQNGAGNSVFRVEDQSPGLVCRLSFQDLAGKELASIHQNRLWGSTYKIQKEGQPWATVGTGFLFHSKLTIRAPGQDDLLAKGDFAQSEYDFERSSKFIAHVAKHSGLVLDSYEVWIKNGEDHILILASAVVIGLCRDQDSWLEWFSD